MADFDAALSQTLILGNILKNTEYIEKYVKFFSTLENPKTENKVAYELQPAKLFAYTSQQDGFNLFHVLAAKASETKQRIEMCLKHDQVTVEHLSSLSKSGHSPLEIALITFNLPFLEVFFSLAISEQTVRRIHFAKGDRKSPLRLALLLGNLEASEMILARMAEPEGGFDEHGYCAADYLVRCCKDASSETVKERCSKMLCSFLSNEKLNKTKCKIIATYMLENNRFLFHEALTIDPSLVFSKGHKGKPPLVWCCFMHRSALQPGNRLEFAKRLIELGADVNDEYQQNTLVTPLTSFAWNVVELLLQNGAKVVSSSKTARRSLEAFTNVVLNEENENKLRVLLQFSRPDFSQTNILEQYLKITTRRMREGRARSRNLKIVEMLANHNAFFPGTSSKTRGSTSTLIHPLFRDIMFEGSFSRYEADLIPLRLKNSDNFDYVRGVPYTLLSVCILKGKENAIRLAMAKGADITLPSRSFCQHNPVHRCYEKVVEKRGISCDMCGIMPLQIGSKVKVCIDCNTCCDMMVCQECYFHSETGEDFSPLNMAQRKGFHSSLGFMIFSISVVGKLLKTQQILNSGDALMNAKISSRDMLDRLDPEILLRAMGTTLF